MLSLEERIIEMSKLCESDCILTGNIALSMNKLIYGASPVSVCTKHAEIDGCSTPYGVYEYYHFKDKDFLMEIMEGIYLPSPEKAILDAIVWLPENSNEGYLVEALQTYQENNDKSKLYEVADHYKVPHEFVDYWWKEAEEESDMSMG